MTDLNAILDDVAGEPRATTHSDLAADVNRGRSALRRRRFTIATNGALALAVIGGLTLAGTGAFDGSNAGDATVAQQPSVPSVEINTDPSSAIQFVAYTGEQPKGFTVETVPAGWKIQGVTEYALLIVPPSGADDSLDSFVGKLVVMLESQDATGPFEGKEIAVGDRTGVVSRPGDGYGQLHFTDANGNRLDVQWPDNKQWTDAEMADFAAGITVLDGAKAGRG